MTEKIELANTANSMQPKRLMIVSPYCPEMAGAPTCLISRANNRSGHELPALVLVPSN